MNMDTVRKRLSELLGEIDEEPTLTVVAALRQAAFDEEAGELIERLRGIVVEAEGQLDEIKGVVRAAKVTSSVVEADAAKTLPLGQFYEQVGKPPNPPQYLAPKKTSGQANLADYPDGSPPERVAVYKDGETEMVDGAEAVADVAAELNREQTNAEEVFDGLL